MSELNIERKVDEGIRIGEKEIGALPGVDMNNVANLANDFKAFKAHSGLVNGVSQEDYLVALIHELSEGMALHRAINGDDEANEMMRYMREVMIAFEEIQDEVHKTVKEAQKQMKENGLSDEQVKQIKNVLKRMLKDD